MKLLKTKWLEFLAWVLRGRARKVLKEHKPLVIGVTGSVGKSTTKEAIYSVLKYKFPVLRNEGNFNNEIGVPLTIIRQEKPEGVGEWLKFIIFGNSFVKIQNDYPSYLVLELAADKAGDIGYLCNLVEPTIGVVTNIGDSHLEFFGNKKKTTIEKRALIESLPREGRAILNFDDERVLGMAKFTKAKVVTYGLKKGAQISAINILVDNNGTLFKLVYEGSVIPVRIKMIGYSFVRAALAATAVGVAVGMDLVDIIQALQTWEPLAGRMRIIEGKNKMTIVDDSYNASLDSVINAIESMKLMKVAGRKVAVLGSMWELGKMTKKDHIEAGKRAGRFFDLLVCVEEFGDIIKQGAIKVGMKEENILVYDSTDLLLKDIDQIFLSGDTVLVKGSQSKNRLEKLIKEIMKDSTLAEKILVRQSKEWQNK